MCQRNYFRWYLKVMKTTIARGRLGSILFYNVLLQKGLSSKEIFIKTGFTRRMYNHPHQHYPLECIRRLAATAYEVSGNPALVFHIYRPEYSYQQSSPMLFLIENCSNLGEVLENISRYIQLDSNFTRCRLDDGDAHLSIRCFYHLDKLDRWIPELHYTAILTTLRKLSRQDIVPIEMRFQHSKPAYHKEVGLFFRSAVSYNADVTEMTISREILQLPVPDANPYLKNILKVQYEELMKNMVSPKTFKDQISDLIKAYLPEAKVDAEMIAGFLNMDRTTMFRKLKREGTSFSELLLIIRKELAVQYLDANLRIDEIAGKLGFSDASAFNNAFKKWFGQSPGHYRKAHVSR